MTLPAGQHEWEATYAADDEGRPLPPRYQALVFADLISPLTRDAVSHLEETLAWLEGKYEYGPDGLLSAVGWGGSWFNGYTAHRGLVPPPRFMSRWEDPVLDEYDAVFHLASNHKDVIAAVQDVLFGEGTTAQGEHLAVREVRRGFVGDGLPAEALPSLNIPVSSPLLFGFRSVLHGNQAPEETVTIASGPLAGGTTAHISRLELDVEAWHAKDRAEQTGLLFAPTVTPEQADALVDDAPSDYPTYERTVAEHGVVGHAQAAARARVNNVPIINRRDFATVDDGKPGTHFISLQREVVHFNITRAAMNGADGSDYHSAIGARHRNGINSFITVTHRATFGIPPRPLRAFPHWNGEPGAR
jgi:hypothetical protein